MKAVKGLQTKKVVTQSQTKEGGNATTDDKASIGNGDNLKLGKVDECPVLEASDHQLGATEWRERGWIFEFKVRVVVNTRRECMSSLSSSLQPMESATSTSEKQLSGW